MINTHTTTKSLYLGLKIKVLTGLFVVALGTCFLASSMAEETGSDPAIMKLKPFIGTWTSQKGTPVGPDTQFQNVYEWAFNKSVIRVKTYLIKAGKRGPVQYETMMTWNKSKQRLVSIGFGQSTFEENVITFSESGDVQIGFEPYHANSVSPMRFEIKLDKARKHFDHVAFMLKATEYKEVFRTRWTRQKS